jgi:membrane-associated phospholipid phosphatase
MDRNAHGSFLNCVPPGPKPVPFNDAGALVRWDPWVRQTVAVTELTRNLAYDATVADTLKLSCRNGAALATMMTMTRPTSAFFADQLGKVQSWAELRDERAYEVLAQIDNQFAFIAAVTGLNVERKKWTMEWLVVCLQFTIEVELMFKHAFACYRPVDFSAQVQPIISTPGHSTYPMGHATQAFSTITALMGLLKITNANPAYTQLVRQARRISVNRVVAGVHFPIDAAAGQMLGLTLGEYFLCMSKVPGATCLERTFAPLGVGGDPLNDFLGEGPDIPQGGGVAAAVALPPPSAYLQKLMSLALAEWAV